MLAIAFLGALLFYLRFKRHSNNMSVEPHDAQHHFEIDDCDPTVQPYDMSATSSVPVSQATPRPKSLPSGAHIGTVSSRPDPTNSQR